jgi:drug/metabolite transporter (DMT)-like permease
MPSNVAFGTAMVLIYNLLSASKEVYSGHMLQYIDPNRLTLSVFFFVFSFFQFASFYNNKKNYFAPLATRRDLLILNIFTCGSWIGFFYSIKYIEPAIVSSLMVGFGPSISILLVPILYHNSKFNYLEVMSAIGILFGTFYLIVISANGNSSLGDIDISAVLKGSILAAIGSVCMVGAGIFSKRLSNNGIKPAAIMAHRFYLLILSATIMALCTTGINIDIDSIIYIILPISFFGVIIPLWCLQIGIKYLEPTSVMIIISTAPTFTYLIGFLDPRLNLNKYILFGVLFICSFAILSRLRWKA